MALRRHVIVGGGTAGWNAITTIRELDGGASEVVLVSAERPYSRMVLPYYLAETISESRVITATPPRLAQLKVRAEVGKRAASLAPAARKLTLDDGAEVEYDDILIATGSSPVRPPVPGAEGPRVHSFWTLDQAKGVMREIRPGSRVAVVGAGFIAFTILDALLKRGARLSVVEVLPRVLPRMVDEPCARLVEGWLARHGVEVRTGAHLTALEGRDGGLRLRFREGDDLEADLVIMATGIRPNLEWLKGSGVEARAGVVVDDHLRSGAPGVYAAGDVAQGRDLVTGELAVHAIEPTAMQHGRVAGANMAGGDVAYEGSLLMNIVGVRGLEVASFGAWEDAAGESSAALRPDRPAYRKLLWRGDRLAGAIVLGRSEDIWTTNDVGMLKGLVQSRAELGRWKERLARDPFDVKRAFVASRTVSRLLPRTLLGRPSAPADRVPS